ncbi:RUS family member 1 isoform X3 [Artibeus jamaicensis]|uniref:RUS family member 1 isoform X3 n=1 Tax=Artibeus jamaicensis TaxID=9417 RepID=UPI00235AADA5|nr:RUS family member 1 isoform X3 [Artibeus jamaicensis]
MARPTTRAGPLCTEQFGSQAARGCCAAADGSLQWETWGWRWWGFSGAGTANPGGRDAGEGGAPGTAFPTLSRLLAVFLPQGFPDSVSPDYLPYQLWDSVQAFASSLSGSLATHAVLLGIGVGNAKASVSAATATWIVKDSTGMLGRIVFAWWKGSKLDCNAKQWRLFADILNDVAMFLEIMAPIYPVCFTVTICISNLAKCIVSVAGGATRAALTMHQARRNNMADVSAKDSSQETLVNLAGLLVSLLMLPLVSDCPSFSLGCFFLLTALHVYANYRAVHALVIETLNEGRLRLVLKHFLQRGEVLDPTSANRMEPLWTGFWPSLSLSLGVPLHRLISSVFELQQLVEGHREPYLLHWDQSQSPKKESWVIIKDTHQVLDKLFPKFLKGLQDMGWKTEKHQLEVDEWRATWLLSPEKKIL